jgi:hypothetical protein
VQNYCFLCGGRGPYDLKMAKSRSTADVFPKLRVIKAVFKRRKLSRASQVPGMRAQTFHVSRILEIVTPSKLNCRTFHNLQETSARATPGTTFARANSHRVKKKKRVKYWTMDKSKIQLSLTAIHHCQNPTQYSRHTCLLDNSWRNTCLM